MEPKATLVHDEIISYQSVNLYQLGKLRLVNSTLSFNEILRMWMSSLSLRIYC